MIYGDEEYTDEFLQMLEDKGLSLETLLERGVEFAADKFIDIAMQTDYLIEDDYFTNVGRLLLDLSHKYERFYELLREGVRKLDQTIVLGKASTILYGV